MILSQEELESSVGRRGRSGRGQQQRAVQRPGQSAARVLNPRDDGRRLLVAHPRSFGEPSPHRLLRRAAFVFQALKARDKEEAQDYAQQCLQLAVPKVQRVWRQSALTFPGMRSEKLGSIHAASAGGIRAAAYPLNPHRRAVHNHFRRALAMVLDVIRTPTIALAPSFFASATMA